MISRPCILGSLALLVLMLRPGGQLTAVGEVEGGLLLHLPFDSGHDRAVVDHSEHELAGELSGEWTDSPTGSAARLDGRRGHLVRVPLPEALRFGKRSWTFSVWLKPEQLTIDAEQNQRRIFEYGEFPKSCMVIDLRGDGRLSWYFCYTDERDEVVAAGGMTRLALEKDKWAHVTLSVDREAATVRAYINGLRDADRQLPAKFDEDFSRGSHLTLGSNWHNYFGVMDEAKIWRRALSDQQVLAEFARLDRAFGVELSPAMKAAQRKVRALALLEEADAAWRAGDYEMVRKRCEATLESDQAGSAVRSYAHLRRAQAYLAQSNPTDAERVYRAIARTDEYPAAHRQEAAAVAAQLSGHHADAPGAAEAVAADTASVLFVAVDGNDANTGSAASPLATLAAARDRARQLRQDGTEGAICITVQPGRYRVDRSLVLEAADSHTIYRSASGAAATLYGGVRLTDPKPLGDSGAARRVPSEARAHVRVFDLKAQGIVGFGTIEPRGFGYPVPKATVELFVDGEAMRLARWPNEGFVGIERLIEPGAIDAGRPSAFEYVGERPARWRAAPDGWICGYFRYLWADAALRIGEIDPSRRTLATATAYRYGGQGMSEEQPIQYYAFNLLEELDQPGEWYLDRAAGRLYLYPPVDLSEATVELGMLKESMVVIDGATDIRLEGLTFDLGRGHGVEVRDSRDVRLAGCTVSRMAGNGVMIHGGRSSGLLSCNVHTIGRRAVEVRGGNRATLEPGGHFVENCHLSNFGRIDRTYTPAIQLEGVGHRVAHNRMHDAPSSVMRVEGNDHVVEFNEIFDAVRESDDQGAIDMWGNPTFRGNVFRHNRFSRIGKPEGSAIVHGQAAIRFDDAISGQLVYGNVFVRCGVGHFGAVQINAGRDNVIDNNLFIACRAGVSGGWGANNKFWKQLAGDDRPDDFIVNARYLQRYPQMKGTQATDGENHIWRNVLVDCGPTVSRQQGPVDVMANARFDPPADSVVAAATRGGLVDGQAELFGQVGFQPIPVGRIGLHRDAWRSELPTDGPVPPQ